MARSVTLGSMRTQARYKADMVNSTFVTDAEFNQYINNSIAELYDLLIQKFGNEYYLSTYDFNSVAGTDLYSLPSDFYKVIGVDLRLSGSDWITIRQFSFNERNRYSSATSRSVYNLTDLRYRVQGSYIRLLPVPSDNLAIRLWYIPAVAELASDSDTFDGVSGWEEYIILDAAIKALNKEESDTSILLAQKQALIQRIEAAAGNRSAGDGDRISDVRSRDYDPFTTFYV